jgi:hypothetical protein
VLELQGIYVKDKESQARKTSIAPYDVARMVTIGALDAHGVIGIRCTTKPSNEIIGLALMSRIIEDPRHSYRG